MSVTSLTLILLIVMIVAFVLSSIKLKSPDISMVVAAVVIAIVGTFMFPDLGNPTRYLVEGLFVNLDLAMLFIAASLFVNIYAHSGAISTITRGIVEKIHNKWLLMSIMGILMLIPGALTGAGSVSIFVLGGIVDTVLESLGISKKKSLHLLLCHHVRSSSTDQPLDHAYDSPGKHALCRIHMAPVGTDPYCQCNLYRFHRLGC